ncbi:polyprenyl synthetase family protein [Mycobacterium basiliense]|uniref:polyprenyl synthetase family protein n=1 Tax=Mycobacterium basiliense TaxID=2094119 RepID=UPI0013014066|nr:polyprenyl synthetase family protein [Mycobacterium basiliense]
MIDSVPPEVRRCAGFHFGWWEADGRETSARHGKAIRPALTVSCARAAGGTKDAAIPAAVAVELLHDFSLLHDDIMDGDVTRRHRPAAWVEFGVPMAILTGDALLTLALDLVHEGPSGAALREAALELCAGQSADLTFEHRTGVRLSECLRMAQQKTGSLFGVACQLGALSAGTGNRIAERYTQFGRHLGLVFQLVDDILGIWGHEAATGKPVCSDLKSRKKSLPVVAALSSGTAAGARLEALLGSGDVLDDDALAHAAELIEDAGGRTWAEAEALRHRALALDALAAAEPEPAAADDLLALVELMTVRVS